MLNGGQLVIFVLNVRVDTMQKEYQINFINVPLNQTVIIIIGKSIQEPSTKC
ncbi:unnamed protein product [Paramecium pentaurelia]|uniref:Uncharacterized protein n=1 Tax=Paramecium pentaurelia TaxID=43138 RepID=A0A8S1VRU2_9CILI|nr:unnamed protein product [Paramecium pentaurelia]